MKTIYEYIKAEETRYQTVPVPVSEGYDWHMYDHVRTTTLYLNSRYKTGNQDDIPFRQIILPKRNLAHRAMDFVLREIEAFVNSADKYHLSFLARKFHEYWAQEQKLADFLDQMTETYDDYGGVLLRNTPAAMEVIKFQQVAFCDQTDILSGPICLKHPMTPDQLKAMESKGWGDTANGATVSIDELITLASQASASGQKENTQIGAQKAKTPGYYIEIYDLEGVLPKAYLEEDGQENAFDRQLQIVAFYTDKDGKEQGVTLFKKKRKTSTYKFKKRDDEDASTYGRALGRGGVEELFEPQVWANYNEMQKKELLDQAAKVLWHTLDAQFAGKNVSEYKQGEIVHSSQPFTMINNSKADVVAFENAAQMWDTTAKDIASAWDTMTGAETKSGMPFALGRLLNAEGHSMHRYRKSKLGNFLAFEVYPDWVIPKLQQEMVKGQTFLALLSLDELQEVVEAVAKNQLNIALKKKILSGELVEPGEQEEMFDAYKQEFLQGGTKRFLELLKDEVKDVPLVVRFNITDEQKDYGLMVEKMSAIWAQVSQILMANPNFFIDHPYMSKLFNQMIESSGLSPIAFGMGGNRRPMQPQLMPPQNANPQAVQSPAQAGRQGV